MEDINKSFLWGHWYPCFGLLVMSTLGFKARVSGLHALSPVHNRFLRFTSVATPADLLVASMAVEPFYPFTCIQAWSGVCCCFTALTRQTLLTELHRLFWKGLYSEWPWNCHKVTYFTNDQNRSKEMSQGPCVQIFQKEVSKMADQKLQFVMLQVNT